MIGASPVAVVLVGASGAPHLDVVLRYMQGARDAMTCWVDIDELDLTDRGTRSWIDAQHARMGRPPGAPVRPGYYLFLDGQVAAYHAGLIDLQRDKISLGVGAAAAIAALYWRSAALFTGAFLAASFRASVRVLVCFEAVIAGVEPRACPAPPPVPAAARDDVALAFEVLGLPPSATQDEAKARFRALAKEWHPDRFTHDATKLTEAGVRMRQIDVAYAVICEAGQW